MILRRIKYYRPTEGLVHHEHGLESSPSGEGALAILLVSRSQAINELHVICAALIG